LSTHGVDCSIIAGEAHLPVRAGSGSFGYAKNGLTNE
jgi:hypothetical protein